VSLLSATFQILETDGSASGTLVSRGSGLLRRFRQQYRELLRRFLR
jgi:hypothetical protein